MTAERQERNGRPILASSMTPFGAEWLVTTHHPCLLHVFEHACNLINERAEILSVVTSQIGNGPFHVVAGEDIPFSEYLGSESLISVSPTVLHLGELHFHTATAHLWNPLPDWERIHQNRNKILQQLKSFLITNFPITHHQISTPLLSALCSAVVNQEISSAKSTVFKLAGLGPGLTPAGDDSIMGAIYAAWILHPPEIAGALAWEIANSAAPRTTSLSAAWLRAAGRGEAGIRWHSFFDALAAADTPAIQEAMARILATGATSGADALAGFMSTLLFMMSEGASQHG